MKRQAIAALAGLSIIQTLLPLAQAETLGTSQNSVSQCDSAQCYQVKQEGLIALAAAMPNEGTAASMGANGMTVESMAHSSAAELDSCATTASCTVAKVHADTTVAAIAALSAAPLAMGVASMAQSGTSISNAASQAGQLDNVVKPAPNALNNLYDNDKTAFAPMGQDPGSTSDLPRVSLSAKGPYGSGSGPIIDPSYASSANNDSRPVESSSLAYLGGAGEPIESPKEIGISFSDSKVVAQKWNGDCAAAAIFNALNLGTPEMRNAIQGLKGDTLQDKYQTFVNRYALKPSEQSGNGLPRTALNGLRGTTPDASAVTGTWADDIRFMLNDALGGLHQSMPGYRGGYANRFDGEPNGKPTQRIHDLIKSSLSQGTPVVMEEAQYAANQSGGFDRIRGHVVTVIGVSDSVSNNSFTLTVYDPWYGRQIQLQTREETQSSFTGYTYETYGNRSLPHPLTANSPFLKFTGASADDSKSGFWVLEQIYGNFDYSKLDPAASAY